MNKRPLVIYHGNCADGFTAAWVFHKKYGANADYHIGIYAETPPDVTGRDVYLVDFSYKRAVVEGMLKTAAKVVLIDHHKTALDDLAGLDGLEYFTDLHRSGANLAWDYLNRGILAPKLIQYVQDRDLWRFELDFTKEVMTYVFAHDFDFDVWDELASELLNDIGGVISSGSVLLMKQRKDIDAVLKQTKRTMWIGGYQVPAANVPYFMSSDAGHILCENKPFAACYSDTETHRLFSLRSSDEGEDVALIAAQYGGGGHRNAAGFKVERKHPLAML